MKKEKSPRHQELTITILSLKQEMQKRTLEAGIPEKRYNRVIPDNLDRISEKDLEALYNWLDSVRLGPYNYLEYLNEQVRTLYGVDSEEIFARYSMFEELATKSREVKLIKEAQKQLRETWRNPYYVKNPRTKRNKKSIEQTSVQPEETRTDESPRG